MADSLGGFNVYRIFWQPRVRYTKGGKRHVHIREVRRELEIHPSRSSSKNLRICHEKVGNFAVSCENHTHSRFLAPPGNALNLALYHLPPQSNPTLSPFGIPKDPSISFTNEHGRGVLFTEQATNLSNTSRASYLTQ
jgi:hypothetical protein